MEELLRHAGLVHTLVRTATVDIEIGGTRIASGERVLLKLAAANRDPNRFSDAIASTSRAKWQVTWHWARVRIRVPGRYWCGWPPRLWWAPSPRISRERSSLERWNGTKAPRSPGPCRYRWSWFRLLSDHGGTMPFMRAQATNCPMCSFA